MEGLVVRLLHRLKWDNCYLFLEVRMWECLSKEGRCWLVERPPAWLVAMRRVIVYGRERR